MTSLDVIELTEPSSERLKPMMADYLQYMAEFTEVSRDKNGQMIYPYLAHYWQEPDRFAFILQYDAKDCGFALVRKLLEPQQGNTYYSMAEFYIAPAYRRLGIGRTAAKTVMEHFSGQWEVSVLKHNHLAKPFWPKVFEKLGSGEASTTLTCEDEGTHYRYDLTV